MKVVFLTLFLLLTLHLTGFAQAHFEVTTLSKKYNVTIDVESLQYGTWRGKAVFSIFKKGAAMPFQIIRLKQTAIFLDDHNRPRFTTVADKRNGNWSSLYLEDLNFDGFEDLAIPDGSNGGYGGISYRIYLFQPTRKQFVFSSAFTRLAQGPFLGIFEIDYKEKTLTTFSKSSCCIHYREDYRLVNGRPIKFAQVNEYYEIHQDGYTWIETKKLVNGRWRTWNKRIKNED